MLVGPICPRAGTVSLHCHVVAILFVPSYVVKKIYHEGTKDTKASLATNSYRVRLRLSSAYTSDGASSFSARRTRM